MDASDRKDVSRSLPWANKGDFYDAQLAERHERLLQNISERQTQQDAKADHFLRKSMGNPLPRPGVPGLTSLGNRGNPAGPIKLSPLNLKRDSNQLPPLTAGEAEDKAAKKKKKKQKKARRGQEEAEEHALEELELRSQYVHAPLSNRGQERARTDALTGTTAADSERRNKSLSPVPPPGPSGALLPDIRLKPSLDSDGNTIMQKTLRGHNLKPVASDIDTRLMHNRTHKAADMAALSNVEAEEQVELKGKYKKFQLTNIEVINTGGKKESAKDPKEKKEGMFKRFSNKIGTYAEDFVDDVHIVLDSLM